MPCSLPTTSRGSRRGWRSITGWPRRRGSSCGGRSPRGIGRGSVERPRGGGAGAFRRPETAAVPRSSLRGAGSLRDRGAVPPGSAGEPWPPDGEVFDAAFFAYTKTRTCRCGCLGKGGGSSCDPAAVARHEGSRTGRRTPFEKRDLDGPQPLAHAVPELRGCSAPPQLRSAPAPPTWPTPEARVEGHPAAPALVWPRILSEVWRHRGRRRGSPCGPHRSPRTTAEDRALTAESLHPAPSRLAERRPGSARSRRSSFPGMTPRRT